VAKRQNKSIVSIKKITAIFLLLLILLSIAPRQLLHDVFASHIDDAYLYHHSSTNHQSEEINSIAFNCDASNIVVELPFECCIPSFQNGAVIKKYSFKNKELIDHYLSQPHYSFSLKGPPVC
jgi:hypothetical protein